MELCKRSTAELRERSTAELRERSTAELRERSTAELRERSTAELRERSTAELRERSTAELRERSTAELRERSTAELRERSTAELRERSTAELRERSTAELQGFARRKKISLWFVGSLLLVSTLILTIGLAATTRTENVTVGGYYPGIILGFGSFLGIIGIHLVENRRQMEPRPLSAGRCQFYSSGAGYLYDVYQTERRALACLL
nr:transmembrane protein 255B isoform X6 [Rattus norvegicus]